MSGHQWGGQGPERQALHEIRQAATQLAQQAQHMPTGASVAFQNVTQVLLIGTALINGVVSLAHLRRILEHPSSPPRGGRGEPEPHRPDRDAASERPTHAERHRPSHRVTEIALPRAGRGAR